jgi:hypothetical protein
MDSVQNCDSYILIGVQHRDKVQVEFYFRIYLQITQKYCLVNDSGHENIIIFTSRFINKWLERFKKNRIEIIERKRY